MSDAFSGPSASGEGLRFVPVCLLLRELGIPVVAVAADLGADNVTRAKHYGIPVVIGRGASGAVLHRIRLQRARALAAVGSDEIEHHHGGGCARRTRGSSHAAAGRKR